MKKRNALILLTVIVTCNLSLGETVSLNNAEEATWRRETMPLPHEIAVKQAQRLKPDAVRIKGRANGSDLEKIAVENVIATFKEKTGVAPNGEQFELLIGLLDDQGKLDGVDVPLGKRLNAVPNKDQAYVIQPDGDHRLIVAALSDRGLYYGTLTLSRWLEFHLTKETAEIPLATVVDWPDMEERGFWHMPISLIPWLSSMKMNRFFTTKYCRFDNPGIQLRDRETTDKPGPEWASPCEQARRYAAEIVPGPGHYDFWEGYYPGFKQAYPDLIGKGEAAKDPFKFPNFPQRVLCASNPDLVKILTTIMLKLAEEKAAEVMVWMSEYPAARCECEKCAKAGGQYYNEVRAAVAAWQEAKKSYPNLKLSVFFGRGGFTPPPEISYPDQDIKDILAFLPPDVTFRASMGCDGPDGKRLADFAAEGKRISRMNIASISSTFMSDDIRHRMEQVLDGKYVGAWQFTPLGAGGKYASANSFREGRNYRLCALAEYSWNAKGRSAKEFAEAWAARQGYREPTRFVEWIDAMTMPQAGRMPLCWPGALYYSWFNGLPDMARRAKWDEAKINPNELEPGVKRSERAVALAEQLGGRNLIAQARLLLAYCRLEQAGYTFIVASRDKGEKKATETAFERLKETLKQYARARLDAVAVSDPDYLDIAGKQSVELEKELEKIGDALSSR